MIFAQRQITLEAKTRGFHLVTAEVLSQLPEVHTVRVGILHLFVKHTSAALTLNENADPTVRSDMEHYFTGLVPEGGRHYAHDTEGDDDMPAHIKSSILGSSIVVPLTMGRPNLGTWQGIYLCEHRNGAGSRELVATIWGEPR